MAIKHKKRIKHGQVLIRDTLIGCEEGNRRTNGQILELIRVNTEQPSWANVVPS